MGERTGIEWADHTCNPWIGCTKVSPGCAHCYAEGLMDHRLGKAKWGAGQPRVRTSAANWREPLRWNAAARKAGVRRRVFCASLADVFDPEVPIEWLGLLFDLIEVTPHLDWQLLTKRPHLIKERIGLVFDHHLDGGGRGPDLVSLWIAGVPPRNVWLGTSVEDQETANERIPHLLSVPARVHFLSCEPLLGPVDLDPLWCDECGGSEAVSGSDGATPFCPTCPGMVGDGNEMTNLGWLNTAHPPGGMIDWVICGGESGPNARPMHPDWARSLRDQCKADGVPFFFKQWGEWAPCPDSQWHGLGPVGVPAQIALGPTGDTAGGFITKALADQREAEGWRPMVRIGKGSAGHALDGEVIQQVPSVSP